jgi:hypothetical protein
MMSLAVPTGVEASALAAWTAAVQPSTIQGILGQAARPGLISFGLWLPASDRLPVDAHAAASVRVLAGSHEALQDTPAPYLGSTN